jgi:hypothetical protein
MLSQSKSAVLQQAAKLFKQHWRLLKRKFKSAFEKADKLIEQKHTGDQFL